jgi:hypothetical protein
MTNCRCELPLSAAIMLLGKGVATINEQGGESDV